MIEKEIFRFKLKDKLKNPIIDNGNLKKSFKKYSNFNKNHIILWIFTILAIAFFSLIIIFVNIDKNGHFVKLRDPKDIFILSYETILQIWISGMSIGISAFLLQRMTNNRLVDTSTIGIGNICLIGLIILVLSLSFESGFEAQNLFQKIVPFVFIISSIIAGLCLYFFSKRRHGFNNRKLIICGVFINCISIALAISLKSNLTKVGSEYLDSRIVGSFDTRSYLEEYLSYAIFLFIILWCFIRSPKFKIVLTDNIIAEQLGLKVKLINLEMILITSVLTGVSYIMSGNVLFLGVASANIAYSFHGKKVMRSMLFSGLITTLFLLVGQFFLSNIIFNLTQLYFETPMITTLLVTPIFIAVILLKKQKV